MPKKLKKVLRSAPWWLVVPVLALVCLLAYDASVKASLRDAEGTGSGLGPRQQWSVMEVGPDGVYGRTDFIRPAGKAMLIPGDRKAAPPRSPVMRLFGSDATAEPWLDELTGSSRDAWWKLHDSVAAYDGKVMLRKKDVTDKERVYEVLDKEEKLLGRIVLELENGHWRPVSAETPSER